MAVDLIAKTTIRRRVVVTKADPSKPGDRDKTKAENISVGRPFEVDNEETAKDLIKSGSARRPTEDEKLRAKQQQQGKQPEPEADLAGMSKDELVDVARARGVDPDGMTKAELLKALK